MLAFVDHGTDGTGEPLAAMLRPDKSNANDAADQIAVLDAALAPRGLKDTGMTNLPLHAFAKNQIWLEIAQLAYELLTWTQLLAWRNEPARVWESQRWPWADLVIGGHRRLAALT